MTEAWLALMSGAIAAAVSGSFAIWVQRIARRADREASRERIEAGAFDRARGIYDSALERAKHEIDALVHKITDAEAQLQRLEGELATEREERRKAIESARREITALRLELAEREATIKMLRRVLTNKKLLPEYLDDEANGEGGHGP